MAARQDTQPKEADGIEGCDDILHTKETWCQPDSPMQRLCHEKVGLSKSIGITAQSLGGQSMCRAA